MKSWSEKKRIEVATAQAMGLNAPMIEAATGVPKETVRGWRLQDWFKDLIAELQREDDYQVDAKLTKIVNKALDTVVDRLENGDFMYDPKTGAFIRKPLLAKDVSKISDTMFDKRNLLRGKPTNISAKAEQISDRLIKLAAEFSRFVNTKEVKGEVIDAVYDERTPGLQEGEPAIQLETIGDTQASPAESSTSDNGEGRISA